MKTLDFMLMTQPGAFVAAVDAAKNADEAHRLRATSSEGSAQSQKRAGAFGRMIAGLSESVRRIAGWHQTT